MALIRNSSRIAPCELFKVMLFLGVHSTRAQFTLFFSSILRAEDFRLFSLCHSLFPFVSYLQVNIFLPLYKMYEISQIYFLQFFVDQQNQFENEIFLCALKIKHQLAFFMMRTNLFFMVGWFFYNGSVQSASFLCLV